MSDYRPRRPPQSRFETLRGLRAHALCWDGVASPTQPLRVLLHGWMDLAASFQFLVDAMPEGAPLVAIDWRGYGQSSSSGADAYWFADYLGDLEAWLNLLCPDQPVDLIAHSMGGNVAMLYAGVRPQRVRRLVNLEGFGLPDSSPAAAPKRLAQWLDGLQTPPKLRPYESLEAVAQRLRKNNPRLTTDKAQWLAAQWSEALPGKEDGSRRLRADPAHKQPHAVPYRKDEVLACWQRIAAPVFFVEGADDSLAAYWGASFPRSELDARLAVLPQLQRATLPEAGHMLHHDQPEALAILIEAFLAGSA